MMNKQQRAAIYKNVYTAVYYAEYGIDNPALEIEIARKKGFPEELLQQAISRAKTSVRLAREGKY